jgi:ankyrin repeat protein
MLALDYDQPALARALLRHGASVTTRDRTGDTAIEYAGSVTNADLLRLLKQHGTR